MNHELFLRYGQATQNFSVFGQVAIGLVSGYVIASVSESYCHRVFGHAPKWLRVKWKRFPLLLGWLRWIYWSHTVIHHGKTFKKDFVTQFRNSAEQFDLDSHLSRYELSIAHSTRYGLTTMIGSFPYFMGPPALMLPILKLLAGNWAAVAAFPMLLLPPLMSMIVHPMIHRSYSQTSQQVGIVGALMRTHYMRCMIRHHWLHHKYPGYNFNLLLLGDWILRQHRNPTLQDLLEMSDVGVPLEAPYDFGLASEKLLRKVAARIRIRSRLGELFRKAEEKQGTN